MRRMQCEQKNHLWLGRFAVHLMELRQDLTLPAAVGRAVRAHGWAAELRPEAAAEIDAQALSAPKSIPRAAVCASEVVRDGPFLAKEALESIPKRVAQVGIAGPGRR